ncbi:acyl carrier protein [Pseudomonas sp. EL_65y_Pfl1_R32]|uniref:acyl carrier protein n=1 Tax=Pseudomonas sp. EL_65y_Pfl1_R32 TaxID=3088696 RepID=UPI0030DB8264
MLEDTLKADITADYTAWIEEALESPVAQDENFLDVGGNSMIALELNKRLRKKYDIEVSIEKLFNKSIADAINHSLNQ